VIASGAALYFSNCGGGGKSSSSSQSSTESEADAHAASQQFLSEQQDRSGRLFGNSASEYFAGVAEYRMIMSEAEVEAAVRKVADVLNSQFVGEKLVLVGILKGAFVFCSHLVRHLNRPYSLYFVEASSYKGQTQTDEIELLSRIVPEKFVGRRVILIDELLDNGATMHSMQNYLIEKLSMQKSNIVKCVLFSKANERRDKKLDADIVGVDDVPDLWLVGCGLDDNGTKRGWPVLYAKAKMAGIPRCADDAVFDADDAAERDAMYAKLRKSTAASLKAPITYVYNGAQ
jgi:hypoxanthine phosphoribosyltransferase